MDLLLVFSQLLLGAIGVLGVAASQPASWLEQFQGVGLGLVIAWLVSRFTPKTIIRFSPLAYVSVLGLLAAVFFVGVSPEGSNSNRWLDLGFATLQPSELMKVTVIAYLTAFFYNHMGDWQIWRPMLVIGLAAGLILIEPDVSTALFVFALAFAIMIAAGTTLKRLASITVVAALIAVMLALVYVEQYPYIKNRLVAYVDTLGAQEQADSTSFQPVRARLTIREAGFFGVGPGRPVRVPEAHNDMIAVSVAYALGFTGIVTLILLYVLIAGRGMRIASALRGPGSLLAAGATLYICAQAALNLLVSAGLLPVTGVVLPFVSHGVNSLLSVSVAMGFLHSAYRQARAEGIPL